MFHSLKPNLKTLTSSLDKNAVKWYYLGLHLDIPASTLDAIEVETLKSCEEALREMLQELLDCCTNPTWRAIVRALKIMD